jgi:hypothetical protein
VKLLRTCSVAIVLATVCLSALWGCGSLPAGQGTSGADRLYNAVKPLVGEAITPTIDVRIMNVAASSPGVAPSATIYGGPQYGTILEFSDGSVLKLKPGPGGAFATAEVTRK